MPTLGMRKGGGSKQVGVTGAVMEVGMGNLAPKEEHPTEGAMGQADDEGKFPGRSGWSLLKQMKGSEKEGRASQAEGAAGTKVQRPAVCVLCSGWHGQKWKVVE